MSQGLWKIRPTTVRRILRIVQSAGLQVERIEIGPDSRLVIIPRSDTIIDAKPVDGSDDWRV